MKVCVTGLRGIPGIIGGVETHCEELLPLIAARAPDIAIDVCARAPYVAGDGDYRGVTVSSLPSPGGKSSEAIVSTFHGVLHARRRHADLIHFHAIGPALLVPLARLFGLKVVMTHHGADYDRSKWNGFAKIMLRLGERLGVGFAHRIICVSPSLREAMAAKYPTAAARLIYIPNGAAAIPPSDRTDAEVLAGLGLTARGYSLAVGRLVPEKGFEYLLDAYASTYRTRPLVIAGSAMHGDDHANILHGKAGTGVKLIGSVPRSTLGALYRNTALFVMPSFHEGLPIAALEAMASAAPMLMSDIPANLDLGLAAQHYFPVGDGDALAAALSGDPARFALRDGSAGRRFLWPDIADATLAVYREIARP